MATFISHAVAAGAMGCVYAKRPMPRRFWDWTLLCAILPDIDVLGFRFGVRYEDFLGHRGFTHSLFFAALLAAAVAWFGFEESRGSWKRYASFAGFLFIVTASHGLFDALTDGGLGVALFSPFDQGRYFLPWHPISVSPIGFANPLDPYVRAVFWSEFVWMWVPCWALAGVVLLWRRVRRRGAAET
ncbi:MAG TPA: hypothetical protein DCM05_09460 [Elusimicrobia bacterium]|nr:hypothetical protein [Elusimicrobiota bacterium]